MMLETGATPVLLMAESFDRVEMDDATGGVETGDAEGQQRRTGVAPVSNFHSPA